VEIKSAKNIKEKDVGKLLRFRGDFTRPRLYILCQETSAREAEGVRILPWRQGVEEIIES
jgi:hypothetical protein